MKVPNPGAIILHSFHRITSSVKIMARVQAETDQAGICVLAQSFDFVGSLNQGACVMMKSGRETKLTTFSGYPRDDFNGVSPMLRAHPVALFIYTSGYGHARLTHIARKNDQPRVNARQKI